MNLRINSLYMKNFKGVSEAKYSFGTLNRIIGANGTGKSTIATAVTWLLLDKDYGLNSNPDIRPIDAIDEITPMVEIECLIDDKPIKLCKMQKLKRSKSDPNNRSLTNSYTINDVPKSERDFKKYLEEDGVNFDIFTSLFHPDMFTKGMGNKKEMTVMRNTLFGMASDITDKEVADSDPELADVAKLLENYEVPEIEAMQNATLRKIRENYGKDGEILRGQIEGVESMRVDIKEIEDQITEYEGIIAEQKIKLHETDERKAFLDSESDGLIALKYELNILGREVNKENEAKRSMLSQRISEANGNLERCNRDITKYCDEHNGYLNQWKKLRANKIEEENRKFDPKNLTCPTCGRAYPGTRVKHMETKFKEEQSSKVELIVSQANICTVKANKAKNEYTRLVERQKEFKSAVDDLQKQFNALPAKVDVTTLPKYAELKKQIDEKEAFKQESNQLVFVESEISTKINSAENVINSLRTKLGINDSCDEKIRELREKQTEYEQAKADAENILDQLAMLGRKKNEMFTEEINKHFRLVKWQLFDYQKNGEVKNCCVPWIDGKKFGVSANTGREVLAKIDIVNTLQNFYNQHLPVFLDNAECLSSETENRIVLDTQFFLLKVAETELTVEVTK